MVPQRLVPKYEYLRAALSVLVGTIWLTLASGTEYPVLHGSDTICNEGVWVNFKCDGASTWLLNDSHLDYISANDDYSINSHYNQSFLSIQCLVKFNSSIIFCFDSITGRQSNSVSFFVQGLLGPVSDLVYLPHNQTLSWEPPYQLNTSQAITYNILVTKVTEDLPIVNHLNRTGTYLDLYGQLERGSAYIASLWPLNAVGRGQETSVMFIEEPAATLSSTDIDNDNTTFALPNYADQHNSTELTSTTGAIVGGVVGGVVAAVVLAVVILALIWGRKRVKHGVMKMRSLPQQQDLHERGTSPSDVDKDGVRKRTRKKI